MWKLKKYLIFVFLIVVSKAFSQDTILPINANGLWGAINSKKELVIAPQYKALEAIGTGEYLYAQDDKSYYVISTKNMRNANSFSVDYIENLSGSWIKYAKNELFGLYNPSKNILIDPYFTNISVQYGLKATFFLCSTAAGYCAQINENGIINSNIIYSDSAGLHIRLVSGKTIPIPGDTTQLLLSNIYAFRENNRWGAIDLNTMNTIIQPSFDALSLPTSATWSLTSMQDSLFGIIDTSGTVICKPKYTEVEEIDTLFKVSINKRYGLLDKNGRELIAPSFDEIQHLVNEYYSARIGNKYMIANTFGEVYGVGFDSVSYLDSMFIAIYKDSKIGLFNVETKSLIIDPSYSAINRLPLSNLLVRRGQLYGVLSINGKQRIPVEYDTIFVRGQFLYLAKSTGSIDDDFRYGLANLVGDKLLDCKYTFSSININQTTGIIKATDSKSAMVYIEFDDNGKIITKNELTNVLSLSITSKSKRVKPVRMTIGGGTTTITSPYSFEFFTQRDKYYSSSIGARGFISPSRSSGVRHKRNKRLITCDPILDRAWSFSGDSIYWVSRLGKVDPVLFQNENGYRITKSFSFGGQLREATAENKHTLCGIARLTDGEVTVPVKFTNILDSSFSNSGVRRLVDKYFRYKLINRVGELVRGNYSFIDQFDGPTTRFAKEGHIDISSDSCTSLKYLPYFSADMPRIFCLKRKIGTVSVIPPKIYPTLANARWGIIDTSGKVIVKAEYNFISLKYKHRYIALKSKWGIIDEFGNKNVDFVWDKIEYFPDFRHGKTVIDSLFYKTKRKKKWGVIDSTGKEIFTPSFDQVYYFGNPKIDLFAVADSGKFRLMNRYRQYVNDLSFSEIQYFDTIQYLYRLKSVAARYTYIRPDGTYLTEAHFEDAAPFVGNRARVKYQGLYCFINRSGNIVSSYYKNAQDFSSNLAAVQIDSLWGFIDTVNHLQIAATFLKVGNFYGNYTWAKVKIKNKIKYCFIDRTGKIVKKTNYDSCATHNNQTFLVFRDDRGFGLVNARLKKIVKPSNGRILLFNNRGMAEIINRNDRFLVDSKGKRKSLNANEFKLISKQLIAYRIGSQWGIMNNNGEILSQPQWQSVDVFIDGLARAVRNDFSRCFITDSCTVLYDYKILRERESQFNDPCGSGFVGILDANGKIISICNEKPVSKRDSARKAKALYCILEKQTTYSERQSYTDVYHDDSLKITVAKHHYSKKIGMFNSNNVLITPAIFASIDRFIDGFAIGKIDDVFGLVDATGKEVAPIQNVSVSNYFSKYIALRSLKSNSYLLLDGTLFWKSQ